MSEADHGLYLTRNDDGITPDASTTSAVITDPEIVSGQRRAEAETELELDLSSDDEKEENRVEEDKMPGRRAVEKIFPCNRPFNNINSARLHAHLSRDELEQTPIFHKKCPYCQKLFFERQHFEDHVSSHERRKNHECPVCKMKFTQKGNLTGHGFVHLSREEQGEVKQRWRHVCYFCNKRFQRPSRLSRHLVSHTMEKVGGRCPLCRKHFSSKQVLICHRFAHLSDDEKIALVEQRLSRVCLFCHKMFPDNDTYRAHLVTHTQEKPFRCDQCGKKYAHHRSFQVHKRSHSSNPKPFSCDECDQAFTRKESLTGHKKTVHRKLKEVDCPECSKKFGTKSAMVLHLNSVHLKIRHPCPHCSKTYTSKSNVWGHVKRVHRSE